MPRKIDNHHSILSLDFLFDSEGIAMNSSIILNAGRWLILFINLCVNNIWKALVLAGIILIIKNPDILLLVGFFAFIFNNWFQMWIAPTQKQKAPKKRLNRLARLPSKCDGEDCL